jgi:uncharacterized protein (UPF0332 family)
MAKVQTDRINYRLSRAKESFEDAQLLAKHEGWNGCLDRLFNSCFRMVSASLLQQGINTKSHTRLNTEFRRYFVKTGKATKEQGALLSNLTRWKYESDFEILLNFDKEKVKPLIPQVKKFLRDIEKLIKRTN